MQLFDWISTIVARIKEWFLEKIMQILEAMLVDVAEGVAEGVEESEEIE